MEWQQLLGFTQVARLGSFTRAGEATFRTQSALSQQIKALEEEMGAPLLERIGKRRLALTPAGEIFFAFASSVLERHERLLEEMQALKGLEQGRLRLAAPFTTLYHLFPEALKEYARRFPRVRLTILDRPQPQVAALVRAGEVDLGVALESQTPRDLLARRWQKVETVVMTPRGHPLTRARRVSLKAIARHPLILPPPGHRAAGRHLLERQFHKLGLTYRVVMESSNVELSARYVEMGLGLSFATVAAGLTGLPGRNLALLPLPAPFRSDYLAFVMRKEKRLAPHQQVLLDLLAGRPQE
ncbi:MAG: LysR family transcriptional regulator [Deltaproteobacteria bacterium]|nr:LysR family transcriptional regulator [Deltaproteobacteria bacterium]